MAAITDNPSIRYNVLIQALRQPGVKTFYISEAGRIYSRYIKDATPISAQTILDQKQAITDAYVSPASKPEIHEEHE